MGNPEPLLEQILSEATDSRTLVSGYQWQMGGDINHAASARTNQGEFFIKWNEARYAQMFEVEARGLQLLAQSCPLKIPAVIGTGSLDGHAYLVLEHLEKGFQSAKYWEQLGEGLAALHLQTSDFFGLDHDNYIGKLFQSNPKASRWVDFFIEARLEAQLDLAISNGYVTSTFEEQFRSFLQKLPSLMPASEASLLHGDLWSGNAMAVSPELASIYDPAAYYGAREMDLAMTRLFGGFDERFYEAYHQVNPIPAHFKELVEIYNLYPLMVHVNLFGANSGYSRSVSQIISRYA